MIFWSACYVFTANRDESRRALNILPYFIAHENESGIEPSLKFILFYGKLIHKLNRLCPDRDKFSTQAGLMQSQLKYVSI